MVEILQGEGLQVSEAIATWHPTVLTVWEVCLPGSCVLIGHISPPTTATPRVQSLCWCSEPKASSLGMAQKISKEEKKVTSHSVFLFDQIQELYESQVLHQGDGSQEAGALVCCRRGHLGLSLPPRR